LPGSDSIEDRWQERDNRPRLVKRIICKVLQVSRWDIISNTLKYPNKAYEE
jgi:hypothetical protein